jgi:hypothetical protein
MALSKLVLKPGINRDQTNYASEGGWYECDKVRFRSGFPEKIGGWERYTTSEFLGVCRSLFNWVATDGNNLLSIATNVKVYVEAGQTLFDITPVRLQVSILAPTGVSATGAIGSVVIPNVSFPVTGLEGTSALGSVTVDIT